MAEVGELVETWRQIIIGDHKSWVMFAHGICVVLVSPKEDLAGQATEILRVHGPVRPGSPGGDFTVVTLNSARRAALGRIGPPGWVVEGDHPDVLNYVAPAEVAHPVMTGLLRICPGTSASG